MSSLKSFFSDLTAAERAAFAERAGTTVGALNQIVYAGRAVELGFADALIASAGGALKLDDVPLTERASKQRRIREAAHAA